MAANSGGLLELLGGFFGFLSRRTDFFDERQKSEDIIYSLTKGAQKLRRQVAVGQLDQNAKAEVEKQLRQKEEEATKDAEKKKAADAARAQAQVKAGAQATEKASPAPPAEQTALRRTSQVDASKQSEGSAAPGYKKIPGNGYACEKYSFTQTLDNVDIVVSTGHEKLRAKDVFIAFGPRRLTVCVKNEILLDEEYSAAIRVEDAMWALEDRGKVLQISLEKHERQTWWKKLFESDPIELESEALQPENSKLSDLDPETRQTVEKMLFEQRQKMALQAGQKAIPQTRQMEMLRKFQEQHPEMDFSQADINFQ